GGAVEWWDGPEMGRPGSARDRGGRGRAAEQTGGGGMVETAVGSRPGRGHGGGQLVDVLAREHLFRESVARQGGRMNETQRMVRDFHERFGLPRNDSPAWPGEVAHRLRVNLIE